MRMPDHGNHLQTGLSCPRTGKSDINPPLQVESPSGFPHALTVKGKTMRHVKPTDSRQAADQQEQESGIPPESSAPPPYHDDIPVLDMPFHQNHEESTVKDNPSWQPYPYATHQPQKTLFREMFLTGSGNRLRWPIVIAAVVLVLDLASYLYVRYAYEDSGFTGAVAYTTFHYDEVFGEDSTPSLIMFAHWPLMKVEGLLRGRKMMMHANEEFVTVHDPR